MKHMFKLFNNNDITSNMTNKIHSHNTKKLKNLNIILNFLVCKSSNSRTVNQ